MIRKVFHMFGNDQHHSERKEHRPRHSPEHPVAFNAMTGPEEPVEVEIIVLTQDQRDLLRKSWLVIYSEIGQSLCYVKSYKNDSTDGEGSGHRGVAETFFRLFEAYPQSQAFFTHLGASNTEELLKNPKLSSSLQEHSVRVLQVVEKIIGRLEDLNKTKDYLINLGRYHRHTGVPSDYFGVMGAIFLHAVRPYLEEHSLWNENVQDVWMILFGHIARVMSYGHTFYCSTDKVELKSKD